MATQTDTRDITNSTAENDAEDTLREETPDEATIPQDGLSTAGDDQPAAPAADIAEIAAQAGRLGIAIDAAKALREGTTPEALRSLVLQRAAAAADARDIVAAPPSPVLPQTAESPIVAAAKRAASAEAKG